VHGCSSLPVTGGFHESKLGPGKLDEWVTYEAVTTSVSGDYANADQGIQTTHGQIGFDEAPTVTKVSASVHGAVILGRVHIGHAAIGLASHNAADGSPSSIPLEGNVLEGVRIDDSKLKITLAEQFYRECDTKEKLAARHAGGLPPYHACLFLPARSADTEVTGFPEAGNGYVKCTIVQDISWDGPAHPTAEIHGHVVRVPGFGRIYFGEMFISDHSRRLTMVRFQLGSDVGGEVVLADGESNGATWPPT
jgi:hypothetical protein